MTKPLIIVDFEFSGHHALHMRHLVRYGLVTTRIPVRVLITKALLERTLPALSEREKESLSACVELLEDDPAWRKINSWIKHRNLACWAYFEYLNRKNKRARILLLYFETIFYGVAFSPFPRFDVSGLMFRPVIYYNKRRMLAPGPGARAVFLLKWLGAYLLRLRPGIKTVFTLDPLAEEYARSVWRTEKFQCIPDPLGPEPGMARPLGSIEAKPRETLHLLLAGALSPRKGLKETVDALEACNEDAQRRIVLTVIGEPAPEFAEYVRSNLDRARRLSIRLVENLRFASDQEMDGAMAAADLILVPYRGFKGSSGMVIRAAHFGKPVISTDDGLMAWFVRTHRLGDAIDVGNPATFSNSIEKFLRQGYMEHFDPQSARRYADDSEPQRFVDKLLAV